MAKAKAVTPEPTLADVLGAINGLAERVNTIEATAGKAVKASKSKALRKPNPLDYAKAGMTIALDEVLQAGMVTRSGRHKFTASGHFNGDGQECYIVVVIGGK